MAAYSRCVASDVLEEADGTVCAGGEDPRLTRVERQSHNPETAGYLDASDVGQQGGREGGTNDTLLVNRHRIGKKKQNRGAGRKEELTTD